LISSLDKKNNEGDSYQSPSVRYGQNKLLGIGLFLVAVSAISFANISAKWASADHHPIDVLFHRNVVALMITVFWIKMKFGNFKVLKTSRPFAHLKRGIVGTVGVGAAFGAFSILPATDATILLFTIPIFTAILSIPILGERVGFIRWSVILIGFLGVYIAVSPSGEGTNWLGVMIALISSISTAVTALFVRDLGKSEPAVTTVFYFLLIGTFITAMFVPFLSVFPTYHMWSILILIGVFGFISQILKTTAYAVAPAALIAPFVYTMLIWSVLADFLLWDTLPTKEVLIGGAIIIASNLFLAWRESQIKNA